MDTSPRRRMTRPAIQCSGDEMLFDFVQRGKQAVLDNLGVSSASGMSGFSDTLAGVKIETILA